jgi:hypothetical protein
MKMVERSGATVMSDGAPVENAECSSEGLVALTMAPLSGVVPPSRDERDNRWFCAAAPLRIAGGDRRC